ncbi:MAG: hypothetical protein NC938_05360 [Candidatus Omnitrophica bacterium]|nr:hypothetical protein [Candidatus Omnitrophota bacterium]MCM8791109.1 hypothetical protein [Candidatus Omnitrophota bacterium]
MTLCPCISSKSELAICNHRMADGMVPSLFERENYCFSLYELCPVFCSGSTKDVATLSPINIDMEHSIYV